LASMLGRLFLVRDFTSDASMVDVSETMGLEGDAGNEIPTSRSGQDVKHRCGDMVSLGRSFFPKFSRVPRGPAVSPVPGIYLVGRHCRFVEWPLCRLLRGTLPVSRG
jgi:hypothetical protein